MKSVILAGSLGGAISTQMIYADTMGAVASMPRYLAIYLVGPNVSVTFFI